MNEEIVTCPRSQLISDGERIPIQDLCLQRPKVYWAKHWKPIADWKRLYIKNLISY